MNKQFQTRQPALISIYFLTIHQIINKLTKLTSMKYYVFIHGINNKDSAII